MEISGDNSNSLRVASFSCYLQTPEENFVLKLAGLQDTAPPFMSPPETPVTRGIRRTSMENQRNCSIFGADKYYSGRMDYDSGVQKQGHMDLHRVKPSLFTARTPSNSSEASSWNSQSGLLQGLQRNPSQMKQRGAVCRRFFPSFGCNGPCATKKAVNVNETGQCGAGSKRSHLPVLKNGEQFPFQALNPGMEKLTVQTPLEVKLEEDPRKSIEVFGSNMLKKGDIAKNLERKLSILTWDAIPKVQDVVSTTYVSSGVCDDMASEASSDLFEIENLSGPGNGLSSLTRQPSERLSSCMMSPTTQYAPSEASIQWSVVTASAADFSSAVSEYDENIAVGRGRSAGNVKEAQKGRRGTGLLGCKSYKSVRVAETACKSNTAADNPKH